MQQSMSAPRSVDDSARQVLFTPTARGVIASACDREGPHAVVLAWPSGAAYLPGDCFATTEHDVVVGFVAGCPVFADTRRLALFVNHRLVVDAEPVSPARAHPPLWVRATPSWEPGRGIAPVEEATGVEAARTQLSRDLLAEFAPRFAGQFAEVMIAAYIREAISDLQGSVSAEALPEMAARLAHHRLCAAIASSPADEPALGGPRDESGTGVDRAGS